LLPTKLFVIPGIMGGNSTLFNFLFQNYIQQNLCPFTSYLFIWRG